MKGASRSFKVDLLLGLVVHMDRQHYRIGGEPFRNDPMQYEYEKPVLVDLLEEIGGERVDVLKINCEGCMFAARLPEARIYAGDFEFTDRQVWAVSHLRWPSQAEFLRDWTERFALLCEGELRGRHLLGCDEARARGFVSAGGPTLWEGD